LVPFMILILFIIAYYSSRGLAIVPLELFKARASGVGVYARKQADGLRQLCTVSSWSSVLEYIAGEMVRYLLCQQ
jgi:hypothetical protein